MHNPSLVSVAWLVCVGCPGAQPLPPAASSPSTSPVSTTLPAEPPAGCAEAWEEVAVAVAPGLVRPDPALFPGIDLTLTYVVASEWEPAVITLESIQGATRVDPSWDDGDPQDYSGKFVQLVDAADDVLYTQVEYYLIEESVEAPATGGGFSNAASCPMDGFISLRDYPNDPAAVEVVLLQEPIDGEVTFGPIREIARIGLP